MPRNLSRPGAYRLNIGVGRATFDSLLGADAGEVVDYTALDRLIPHPVYARQRWISILNPSEETFEKAIKPLLAEAHGIVARRSRR